MAVDLPHYMVEYGRLHIPQGISRIGSVHQGYEGEAGVSRARQTHKPRVEDAPDGEG